MILNSPYISGSLTVTGNITACGGVTISGSIASASYAVNSSYLNGSGSGEFVPTGSFNTASGSFSTRISAIEGNYITTGSNTFIGNQTITGSILQSGSLSVNGCIVSTGQIVAQTINVQQVTSSVVYSCGSNIFGCAITDTQRFTGSVSISGSFDVKTSSCSNITFTGDCANVSAINSYSTTNGFQTLKYAAGTHMFYAGAPGGGVASEAMRITCCGTVVVGYNKAGISDTLQRTMTLGGRPDNGCVVSLGFDAGCAYRADIDFSGVTGRFEFWNYNAAVSCWGSSPKLLIDINGITCFSSRVCTPVLTTCNLRLSDETTFGLTICKGPSTYPIIIADGAQSIGFYTCESGGAFGERLKIWQTGAVTIGCQVCIGAGTDTPINPNRGLYITHNGTTALTVRDSTNDSEFTTQVQSSGTILGTLTNHDLIVYTCNTERMRIANNGVTALCINSALVMAKGTVAQRPTATSGMLRYNSDYNLMEFYNGSCWVQMGSGDLATGFCFNNTSMCHNVYQAAGTLGLIGQGSPCITIYGAATPSMGVYVGNNYFSTHGGHCGISDYPGYWGVNLGAAKAVNQLKVWIHSNSWGYFELQGSNNSGNASGFATNGTWTTLSFLCSNINNCQNMGGNASGCSDGTIFTFWYTNDVPFQAYRIKVLDSSRSNQALGSIYAGSAGYIWQLNRV